MTVLVGVAVTAAFLLSGEPTAITVEPNWVAVIDPKTNDVVDAVPAGTEPGPIAFGGGAVWVGNAGNVDGKSVTRDRSHLAGRSSRRSRSMRRRPGWRSATAISGSRTA